MNLKDNKLFKKTINLLLNILIFIFGIILLVSIYTGVQTKILGNSYSNFFGYSVFEVQTGSMADTINPNDWIIVKLTQNVKINDIITYKLNDEYITHRVVEAYGGTYVTRGDANNANDKPIDQKQIVGKVVTVLVNFGVLRKTIFNPTVLIALILTILLFNLIYKKDKGSSNSGLDKFTSKLGPVLSDLLVKLRTILSKLLDAIINLLKNLISKIRKAKKTNNKNLSEVKLVRDEVNERLYDKTIDINKVEDDLEKTSVYRVISIDANKGREKLTEEELEKTAYFRDIPVNYDEVINEEEKEQKISSEKNKEIEMDNNSSEEELEKTALYRVISVDSDEVADKYKLDQTTVMKKIELPQEEDLEKTSLYRVIPVDAEELDETFLEIANNQIKEKPEVVKETVKKKEPVIEEKKERPKLTDIDLENLKKKKGKNVIDTAMTIKKEELEELFEILAENEVGYIRKASVVSIFISNYIKAKYYHYIDLDVKYNGKNTYLKIKKVIKELVNTLINTYRGSDNRYSFIVKTCSDIFTLISNLEQANNLISKKKAKEEFYKKEIKKFAKEWDNRKLDEVVKKIITIQDKTNDMLDYFLQKIETNMFEIEYNKISTRKTIYGVDLGHNISFSKVYSDYIIDKTYTEGIIAEDKIMVLLNLLSIKLIKNMINSDFKERYMIHIPGTLYSKEKKLERVIRIIDDEYAKDAVIILISFSDLCSNKQVIKDLRKEGYKFALFFKENDKLDSKNKPILYVNDYIFIDRKATNKNDIINYIPSDLNDKIIYDTIFDKIGDLDGE